MDCKYLENEVWLYVEGDLEPRTQEAATRHIAGCDGCAELVEEARASQEWLRSSEPARFDETFMDSIRRGARQKIAEQKASHFQFAAVFVRVNWKPLIIACPALLLICWVAVHWAAGTRSKSANPAPVAGGGGSAPKDWKNTTDHLPENIVAVRDLAVNHHKRRIVKRFTPVPTGNVRDRGDLLAGGWAYPPPLRIEIQTEDPNVRIIWFASPGDGSVPFGPDK